MLVHCFGTSRDKIHIGINYFDGAVCSSNCLSQIMAEGASLRHISASGCRPLQQAGRSGWPKMAQRKSGVNWTQRTPAGLPSGMPGIGLLMDGAIQHAPQCGRQSTLLLRCGTDIVKHDGGNVLRANLSHHGQPQHPQPV